MRAFRSERDVFAGELDPVERQVLADVLADVAVLLGAARDDDGLLVVAPDAVVAGPDGSPLPAAPTWSLEDLPTPEDPALLRLLPDATDAATEPEAAAEFRRLTEADLRATKITRLVALWRQVREGAPGWPEGTVVVAPDDAPAVAATLTDVRLVLADRLGLETDEQVEALYDDVERAGAGERRRGRRARRPEEEDPAVLAAEAARQRLAAVYGALTWWQETLVTLMLGRLRG